MRYTTNVKFICIANFKSNKTSAQVKEWVEEVCPHIKSLSQDLVVGVAPSHPHLSIISELLTSRFADTLEIAAQDVSPFPEGSYTGAVNAAQLKDLSVTHCLIGHSERRQYFHESPMEIANKASELVKCGINPVLCLREDDIFPQLAALPEDLKDKLIYCFEPPGEIGGTEIADVKEIKRVVETIKSSFDQPVKVMYGGSVNAGNIKSLISNVKIDGVLAATASLEPSNFLALISTLNTL